MKPTDIRKFLKLNGAGISTQLAQMEAEEKAMQREEMATQYSHLKNDLAKVMEKAEVEKQADELKRKIDEAKNNLKTLLEENQRLRFSIGMNRVKVSDKISKLKNELIRTAPREIHEFLTLCNQIESVCDSVIRRPQMMQYGDPVKKIKTNWKELHERAKTARNQAIELALNPKTDHVSELSKIRKELDVPAALVAIYNPENKVVKINGTGA